MIRFELPTGRTVMLTAEKWLSLTDEDIQKLIAEDKGVFISDPFDDFDYKESRKLNLPELEVEDLDEETIKQIKKEIDGEATG